MKEKCCNGRGAAAVPAAVKEAGPVVVTVVIVAEAAEVRILAVLARQKRRPGKGLPHQMETSGKPAALLFPL